MSIWEFGGSDLVLEHLEEGRTRPPQPETSLSRDVQGLSQGRGFGHPQHLLAGHRSPALPLGTPSTWPGRSTRLSADCLPRRGLATLCPLTPPRPTWPAPRSHLSRLHPSPAPVPGTLKAAPPAPQRRPLLPQERSSGPAGFGLHRPGRGPTARAHSGGLGPRRCSAGRSDSTPQPTPRPAPLAGPKPRPCPAPNSCPARDLRPRPERQPNHSLTLSAGSGARPSSSRSSPCHASDFRPRP